MKENFSAARKTFRTSGHKTQIEAINGCCYGRDKKEEKGDYLKLCGESFWTFISGNPKLYTEIIIPLGHEAKERNEEFLTAYSKLVNRITKEFMDEFCDEGGNINWEKVVKLNSSKDGKY